MIIDWWLLIDDYWLMIVDERKWSWMSRELKEIGPQADGVGEQQLTAIGQQLKENDYWLMILWINMKVFDDLFGGLK